MAKINWLEKLGWTEDQLDDIRVTGYAYIRQGKYNIAVPFFEALHVLAPDSAYDAQTLGALYVQMGNPAKALRYLDRALKLQADHGPTLLNLAKAFLMLGNKKEGLKIAAILRKSREARLRSMAEALFLAFG
ncbi:MAG: tetratricopeptide repeat protein [Chlamydiales bacterium]|nr:tetratricopeptide repeat protein [Chlamydiales bacterium]